MKSVIFINSHPIQYFAPMYKFMTAEGMKTMVWYCSDESLQGVHDKEFGIKVKWDIPLLEGYEYRFFKNYSWKPSYFKGFFGLINLGMIRQLFKEPKSVIIVHGWHYLTHMLILMLGRLKGHTVCLRNETPLKQEILKTGWKQTIKKIGLKYLLFPPINNFLYIGRQNYLLYGHYGVKENRLIFCPYAIDNKRFQTQSNLLKRCIPEIKNKLGIPASGRVILFSAKYIEKKRPLDLLKAFSQINISDCWLIMVGEGELRNEMEQFILKNNLQQVIITGFVNQSKISEYYAISEVFVMCSSMGETWGLSVNEAMNFNLPLIISDLTGCADDLVKSGDNGYTFMTGNVNDLASKLKQVLAEKALSQSTSSLAIVQGYSYDTVVRNLNTLVS